MRSPCHKPIEGDRCYLESTHTGRCLPYKPSVPVMDGGLRVRLAAIRIADSRNQSSLWWLDHSRYDPIADTIFSGGNYSESFNVSDYEGPDA